jgi:protein O-mannosyl-transferase
LLLATLSVYAPVVGFEFLNYDDDTYVAANLDIQPGLRWDGVKIAFTRIHHASWHPLTTLSHMLDCSLFGQAAGGHHALNAVLHGLNTVGIFLLLVSLTRARWRSACVAALFGLHPMHVESVAWVSERKDVLSTGLWVLTLASYVRYARRPSLGRYGMVMAWDTLALMAKPMVVTIPAVLLLLDFWPLRRMGTRQHEVENDGAAEPRLWSFSRLLLEKLPLLIPAGAVGVLTVLAQSDAGAMVPMTMLPLQYRLANVPVAYARYIGKMLWPTGLAILYPYRLWAWWQLTGAIGLLVAVSVAAVWLRKSHPYVLMGWLWYLITLLPAIGVVQVGAQSIADRYSYVPYIGLFIMLSWGVPELLNGWRHRRRALTVTAVAVGAVCWAMTWVQVHYWQNSLTLFGHALAVTTDNYIAHDYFGRALEAAGRPAEAVPHYQESVRMLPQSAGAHRKLGGLLAQLGRFDAAAEEDAAVVRLEPDVAASHYNLANVLVRQGKLEEAVGEYRRAIELLGDWAEPHHNLGIALASQGRSDEALEQYSEALRLRPDYAEAYVSQGMVLAGQGHSEEAIAAYRQALRLRPDFGEARRQMEMLEMAQPHDVQP